MSFKIKNWKLALLALVVFCAFISLGFWQLARAHQKQHLLESYHARMQKPALTAAALEKTADLRFYRASLQGQFDNQHTFLLDNKTFKGQVGYEIYTPFKITGTTTAILVDRGFIPLSGNRSSLPAIRAITQPAKITGLLNLPPAYVSLGEIKESQAIQWPLRIEYVNLPQLAELTGYSLFSTVLLLQPNDPAAYPIEWQIVVMSPERHTAYAVQWFAFALTLLVLFFALN